jgi:hypothetical protein
MGVQEEMGIVKFLLGLGSLTIEASWSHSDIQHSVGRMWTGD